MVRRVDRIIDVRWVFTVNEGKVSRLAVTRDVTLPHEFKKEVIVELTKQLVRGSAGTEPDTDFDRPVARNGESHPRGCARRMDGYVYGWGPGALGAIDWINTLENASDPVVYRTFRSPASGEHIDKTSKRRTHRVDSHLSAELRWDSDGYQKLWTAFSAEPSHWNAVAWCSEWVRLVDRAIPRVTGTLTLTGPDGAVASTEEVTAKGARPPYPLRFEREFALDDVPSGTYTLTFTHAEKTGGSYSQDGAVGDLDRVTLRNHTLTFNVGA
ncbi:hypothetical protein OG897_21785 [Streptomyces sp. NBC_00237]|uniref:hypothetical protein n=1 Tax=Streptomyces sp. NBC_00237 TaxID=2975687 RepID=UPI00224CA327|nr:hypothetical protein [Streptomyces sp. NBC_00237]MCX5204071.1 hypothetical protein [Streptomyces sp. NBC_00237]